MEFWLYPTFCPLTQRVLGDAGSSDRYRVRGVGSYRSCRDGGVGASITLIKGDLNGIARAQVLSHKVMKNIRENLFFALAYNVLGIPVAAGLLYPSFGILLSPMIAALAMSLSSVSVITNSLRLRNVKLV